MRLNIEHQRNDGQSTPLVFRSAGEEKANNSQDIPYGDENRTTKTYGGLRADSTNNALSIKMDWDLGHFTLTSITGWREYNLLRNLEIPELDGDRTNIVYNGGERTVTTYTQEFRLTSESDETLEYTVGALWFDNETDNKFSRMVEDIPTETVINAIGPANIPPQLQQLGLVPGASFNQFSRTDGVAGTENLGIYAQGTWHITDRWHLTAGARYILEELDASVIRDQYTELDLSGARISETSVNIPDAGVTDEATTGTLSLQYDWNDSSRIYTTISTGYRGGAFDFANSDLEAAFENPVSPETALSFEVGTKSRFWDDRLELNIALFNTVFKDFQAQVIEVGENDVANPVQTAQFSLDNAGELETQGVEIEFKAKPLASLFITGSVLYNKAVFNEFVSQCFNGQQPGEAGGQDVNGDGECDQQDLAGATLPNAPEWSVSLTGRYEFPLSDDGSQAYLQVHSRWQDDVQFTSAQHPLTIQDAYSVSDIRAGWRSATGRYEVGAYVNNVFAQHYVVAFFPLSVDGNRNDVAHTVPVGADRVMGLSFAYQW